MNRSPSILRSLRLLVFGKSLLAGLAAWLMFGCSMVFYLEYSTFGKYDLANTLDRPYLNFYHLMFLEDWREKFTPRSLCEKMKSGQWEQAPDENLSLSLMRAGLLRWHLRQEFPEVFRSFLSGLVVAGRTPAQEWVRFFTEVDAKTKLTRQSGRAEGHTNPLNYQIHDEDTLVITIKGSGLTPLVGPIIRVVVESTDGVNPLDGTQLPTLRWCLDDRGDLRYKRYREVLWNLLPSLTPQTQRVEFLFDMSFEPEWLNPQTKPQLFFQYPRASKWKVLQLESLEAMP